MPEQRYAAHEHLVALARPGRALWRLLLGLFVVAGVVFGLNSAMYAVLRALAPSSWMAAFIAPETQGASPLSMLILLGSFVFLILAVMFAARQLQKRQPLGLVGPLGLAFSQFWQVLRALLILGIVLVALPPWGMGAPLEQNLAFAHWLLLLPVSLLAILIQTSAEEILFRGYIQ